MIKNMSLLIFCNWMEMMTEKNKKLLGKLGYKQYIEFLRRTLGLKAFFNNETFKILSTPKNTKKFKKYIGEYSTDNKRIKYCIIDGDDKKYIFRDKDKIDAPINIDIFFSSIDDEYILWILLSILDFKSIGNLDDTVDNISLFYGKKNIVNKKIDDYRFILGAGINLDHNLHIPMGNWTDLIESMRSTTRNILNIQSLPNPQLYLSNIQNTYSNVKRIRLFDELTDFEGAICNTNYVGPQILKDLDNKAYYNNIYDNLYPATSDFTNLKVSNNSSLVDTCLYQVARIIEEKGNGRVLTFNYDSILEGIINYNFERRTWQSVYNRKVEDKNITKTIVHPHGFYPCGKKSTPKGIILSTAEYIRGYSSGRYPYKKLQEQLQKTNYLIGNSLSDYEEQKVFSNCFSKTPSNWHFLLTKKEQNNWINVYKTIYFMKIGVIPVFFDDYSDITDYLKSI